MKKPKIGKAQKLAWAAKITNRTEQLKSLLNVEKINAEEFRKCGRDDAAEDIEKNMRELELIVEQNEDLVKRIEADAANDE